MNERSELENGEDPEYSWRFLGETRKACQGIRSPDRDLKPKDLVTRQELYPANQKVSWDKLLHCGFTVGCTQRPRGYEH